MSKEFYEYMDGFKDDFIINKKHKKKHKYSIKKGFINFNINLINPDCPFCDKSSTCSLKKCIHIYKIYNTVYNVPRDKLVFLWINDNYLKVLNNEKMVILPDDIECPICLENAGFNNYIKNKTIHCLDCGKFYHTKCLDKTKKGKVCLICTNNWLPEWLN